MEQQDKVNTITQTLTLNQWKDLISYFIVTGNNEPLLDAHTYIRDEFNTFSKPVIVYCKSKIRNNDAFVIKGHRGDNSHSSDIYKKANFSDFVVGRIGNLMGAPVGEVALVNIPEKLIKIEPKMSHFESGVVYGCKWIDGCIDDNKFKLYNCLENKSRFAKLGLLYGLFVNNDSQVIYKRNSKEAFSIDHGHCFPNGPYWNIHELNKILQVKPDQKIQKELLIEDQVFKENAASLYTISDTAIAKIVGTPPWEITLDDRAAVANFIKIRIAAMLRYLGLL